MSNRAVYHKMHVFTQISLVYAAVLPCTSSALSLIVLGPGASASFLLQLAPPSTLFLLNNREHKMSRL